MRLHNFASTHLTLSPDPPSRPVSLALFPEHAGTFLPQCFSRLSSRPGMSFLWCLRSSWLSFAPPPGICQIFSSHGGCLGSKCHHSPPQYSLPPLPSLFFPLPTDVSRGATYFSYLTYCVSPAKWVLHASWNFDLFIGVSAAR